MTELLDLALQAHGGLGLMALAIAKGTGFDKVVALDIDGRSWRLRKTIMVPISRSTVDPKMSSTGS